MSDNEHEIISEDESDEEVINEMSDNDDEEEIPASQIDNEPPPLPPTPKPKSKNESASTEKKRKSEEDASASASISVKKVKKNPKTASKSSIVKPNEPQTSTSKRSIYNRKPKAAELLLEGGNEEDIKSSYVYNTPMLAINNDLANGIDIEKTKVHPFFGCYKQPGYNEKMYRTDSVLCYCENKCKIYKRQKNEAKWQQQNNEWKSKLFHGEELKELRCPNMQGRGNTGCGFRPDKVAFFESIKMFTEYCKNTLDLDTTDFVCGLLVFYCRCANDKLLDYKLPFQEAPPDLYCSACYTRVSFEDALKELYQFLFSKDQSEEAEILLNHIKFICNWNNLIRNTERKAFKWQNFKIAGKNFELLMREKKDVDAVLKPRKPSTKKKPVGGS